MASAGRCCAEAADDATARDAHTLAWHGGGGGAAAAAQLGWQSVASEKRSHWKYFQPGPPSSHSPSLVNAQISRSPHSASSTIVVEDGGGGGLIEIVVGRTGMSLGPSPP